MTRMSGYPLMFFDTWVNTPQGCLKKLCKYFFSVIMAGASK